MRERVHSTSWPNRHSPYFARLDELLRARGGTPLVTIVGPGAVTRICRPLLSDAGRPMSRIRRLVGDAARYSDQLLRRIPGFPLVSLEPDEVQRALTAPHRLAVVDISQHVLHAVARAMPEVHCVQVDLSHEPIPFVADVVIAFNVICRASKPDAAMRNVLAGLVPDGMLLLDARTAARLLPPEFQLVAPKTYRRKAPAPP